MLIELKYDNSGFTVNSVKTIKNINPAINVSSDSYIDQILTIYKTDTEKKSVSTWGYQRVIGNPSYTLTGYKIYTYPYIIYGDVYSFEDSYRDELAKLTK